MRRSTPLLVTCLLALATGLALLGAGIMIVPPGRQAGLSAAPSGAAEANEALAQRLYDAVNTVLAAGDSTQFDKLLADDFVDQVAHSGFAPTRDGLVHHLLALRATFPTLWIVVEELQPHGNWVLARLRVEGAAQGVFIGVPVGGTQASWEAIDLLRIAGGRIAERLTAGDWPAEPQPLVQVPLPEPPTGAVVRLGRLTFAPGASQPRLATLGQVLVVLEAGTLTAGVEGETLFTRGAAPNASAPSRASTRPSDDIVLGAGDALWISFGARYTLKNDGPAPAVVLTLALLPWSAGAPDGQFLWPEATLPDVTAHLLIQGVVEDLPTGPAMVALGRVTLAPGADLTASGTTAPQIAVVEAGSLHLETSSGLATILSAGVGTLIPPAPRPTFRNGGENSLVLLLVAITPAAPEVST